MFPFPKLALLGGLLFFLTATAAAAVTSIGYYANSLDNFYYDELSNTVLDEDSPNNTGSWHLVFSDEFSKPSLDTTKWEYQSGCDDSGYLAFNYFQPTDLQFILLECIL